LPPTAATMTTFYYYAPVFAYLLPRWCLTCKRYTQPRAVSAFVSTWTYSAAFYRSDSGCYHPGRRRFQAAWTFAKQHNTFFPACERLHAYAWCYPAYHLPGEPGSRRWRFGLPTTFPSLPGVGMPLRAGALPHLLHYLPPYGRTLCSCVYWAPPRIPHLPTSVARPAGWIERWFALFEPPTPPLPLTLTVLVSAVPWVALHLSIPWLPFPYPTTG